MDRPRIKLGTSGRKSVHLDVAKLVDTRMLVQANSGGGKSYAVRVIAEQAMAHVQTIVLDPEGEFSSLRELHDVLLVGPDGDLDTDVRAAALLARRLAEKGCSAVIDLYELGVRDRPRFVKDFCLSLLRMPKGKFHPMLVFLDEAPDFCPERGLGQSVATDAVISLMSQGRKRGIGMCLAAQRMSQLHKTATAQANNYLLGRTAQDTDRKRVAQDLGLEKADRDGLRGLDEGEFWAYGPAFSHTDVRKVRVARSKTTHPESGVAIDVPPAPSKKIRGILHEFSDLPERAREEANTILEAQETIRRLERDNVGLKKRLEKEDPEKLASLRAILRVTQSELEVITEDAGQAVQELQSALRRLTVRRTASPGGSVRSVEPARAAAPVVPHVPSNGTTRPSQRGGKHRILVTLAQFHPTPCTDRKIGILADLAVRGGTFSTYLSRLRKEGLIDFDSRSAIAITQDGVSSLGSSWSPLPTGDALRQHWLSRFSGGKRRILEVLFDAYPDAVDRDSLAHDADLTGNGGTFSTYLGKLHTLDLTEGRNPIRASPILFGDA